jgi:spermidine/putrescine-binding protein
MKNRLLPLVLLIVIAIAGGVYSYDQGWFSSKKQPEINILVWGGYEDPSLIEPFTKKYGVKVNYKTFFGGDAMFALLTQSKGVYDVVVVDPEYIQKLYMLGRLSPLNPAEFDMSSYLPYFRKFLMDWRKTLRTSRRIRLSWNSL